MENKTQKIIMRLAHKLTKVMKPIDYKTQFVINLKFVYKNSIEEIFKIIAQYEGTKEVIIRIYEYNIFDKKYNSKRKNKCVHAMKLEINGHYLFDMENNKAIIEGFDKPDERGLYESFYLSNGGICSFRFSHITVEYIKSKVA